MCVSREAQLCEICRVSSLCKKEGGEKSKQHLQSGFFSLFLSLELHAPNKEKEEKKNKFSSCFFKTLRGRY